MTSAGPGPVRADAGFTVLELLIALAIVVLAVALAVPSFSRSRGSLAVHSAAFELAAQLRSARAAARATNAEQSVTLDAAGHRYWQSAVRTSHFLPVTPQITVPDSERLDGATSRIRFFPDGGASGGHIVLRDARSAATVHVDWLTSDVRVRLAP